MKYRFWMVLLLTSVISLDASAGLSFATAKRPQPKMIETESFLSENNKYLRDALNIHNIINQLPGVRNVVETSETLSKEKNFLNEELEVMDSCFAQNLASVYKNPDKAWANMANAYENMRQAKTPKSDMETLSMTSDELIKENRSGWFINREIMIDIYKNPQKYGDLTQDGSFSLWKDQVTLFNKQWNQFYENLNAQFGDPLKGRPAVDDSVRLNPKKYDQVVQAHKAYLAGLQRSKKKEYTALPPKAPDALPEVNNMVFVDRNTKRIYPELPEIWKSKENQKALANSDGEFANFFNNGDVKNPTDNAMAFVKGDLEKNYDMRLAIDSMDKGSQSVDDTVNQMRQIFLKKLADVGIDTSKMTLASKADFAQARKLLKDKKKEAIQKAYGYVEQLEKQDLAHPELIANRQKVQQERQARLSRESQRAIGQMDQTIISISQMSPVAQQKLVLAALEKDSEALVYLTETNAMNVDQLMRERQSTNKIISESQQKVQEMLDQQDKMKSGLKKCSF